MENIKIDTFYKVADDFFLKIDDEGIIHISYHNDIFLINIKEFLDATLQQDNSFYLPHLNEIVEKGLDNFTEDPELPKNYYLEFSIETLREILKKSMQMEDYDRCDKIKKVIDFKLKQENNNE